MTQGRRVHNWDEVSTAINYLDRMLTEVKVYAESRFADMPCKTMNAMGHGFYFAAGLGGDEVKVVVKALGDYPEIFGLPTALVDALRAEYTGTHIRDMTVRGVNILLYRYDVSQFGARLQSNPVYIAHKQAELEQKIQSILQDLDQLGEDSCSDIWIAFIKKYGMKCGEQSRTEFLREHPNLLSGLRDMIINRQYVVYMNAQAHKFDTKIRRITTEAARDPGLGPESREEIEQIVKTLESTNTLAPGYNCTRYAQQAIEQLDRIMRGAHFSDKQLSEEQKQVLLDIERECDELMQYWSRGAWEVQPIHRIGILLDRTQQLLKDVGFFSNKELREHTLRWETNHPVSLTANGTGPNRHGAISGSCGVVAQLGSSGCYGIIRSDIEHRACHKRALCNAYVALRDVFDRLGKDTNIKTQSPFLILGDLCLSQTILTTAAAGDPIGSMRPEQSLVRLYCAHELLLMNVAALMELRRHVSPSDEKALCDINDCINGFARTLECSVRSIIQRGDNQRGDNRDNRDFIQALAGVARRLQEGYGLNSVPSTPGQAQSSTRVAAAPVPEIMSILNQLPCIDPKLALQRLQDIWEDVEREHSPAIAIATSRPPAIAIATSRPPATSQSSATSRLSATSRPPATSRFGDIDQLKKDFVTMTGFIGTGDFAAARAILRIKCRIGHFLSNNGENLRKILAKSNPKTSDIQYALTEAMPMNMRQGSEEEQEIVGQLYGVLLPVQTTFITFPTSSVETPLPQSLRRSTVTATVPLPSSSCTAIMAYAYASRSDCCSLEDLRL